MRVSPFGAACSSRAATLTASPVTSVSPSPPTTTSPVLTPMRASSPCSAIAARISAAARTARSASSSCETGMPKTAMTASPTNFSTEPPCRSRIDAKILEVAAHPRAQRLGVGRLAERRRADEVAEEDRDDLALLAGRLGDGERGSARAAEARVVGVLAPAARASRTRGVYEGRRAKVVEHRRERASPTRRCPSARGTRSRARPRAMASSTAADARERLGEHVVDIAPSAPGSRSARRARRASSSERERLVVLPAGGEDSCSRRPPPGLRVEIVRAAMRPARRRRARAPRRSGPGGRGRRRGPRPTVERTPTSPISTSTSCPRRSSYSARSRSPAISSRTPMSPRVEALVQREVELVEQRPRVRGRARGTPRRRRASPGTARGSGAPEP